MPETRYKIKTSKQTFKQLLDIFLTIEPILDKIETVHLTVQFDNEEEFLKFYKNSAKYKVTFSLKARQVIKAKGADSFEKFLKLLGKKVDTRKVYSIKVNASKFELRIIDRGKNLSYVCFSHDAYDLSKSLIDKYKMKNINEGFKIRKYSGNIRKDEADTLIRDLLPEISESGKVHAYEFTLKFSDRLASSLTEFDSFLRDIGGDFFIMTQGVTFNAGKDSHNPILLKYSSKYDPKYSFSLDIGSSYRKPLKDLKNYKGIKSVILFIPFILDDKSENSFNFGYKSNKPFFRLTINEYCSEEKKEEVKNEIERLGKEKLIFIDSG
jgi:hypothetical protein